jgi:hypothetical protein
MPVLLKMTRLLAKEPRPALRLLLTAFAGLVGPTATLEAAPSAEAIKFFEAKVRPILVESCQECHSEKKHKGDLRLDNLPFIVQGGSSGPAIVPHKPDESLLIKAVSYADPDMEMPPDGKLPEEQIAILKQWIQMGAPWPEAEVAAAGNARRPGQITDEDRKWWAFQPVKNPKPPALTAPTTIDAFILERLKKEGLAPAPEATPQELLRRLYFDLTGLPPTPEDAASFLAESEKDKQGAYERLVDRLLASPRYGERWAQHWLDIARYAESEGYRLDSYRPNAWPYRDYVIRSLNEDKPYNQFVREQIAGDELAPNDPQVAIGTAFLRHTIYEYNQRDAEGQWKGILNEVTDVTADVFMGLSVQCAQCHDHKFDPILQKDYYRLQSFLANITWPENKPLATPEEISAYNEKLRVWEEATKEPRAVIDAIIEPKIARAEISAMEKFPDEVQAMWRKPREQRTPYEEQIVQLAWRQADYERYRFKEDKIKDPEATQLRDARAQLAEFDHLKPKPLLPAFVIGETGSSGRDAKFTSRRAGTIEAKPGFLTILEPSDAVIPAPESGAATSGRRTVLADWLTRPDNPLTTRVIVNRVWQYHFGRGIAGTPSDFGRLGEAPTHPELLDWLTTQFVKGGWKLKPLHKMIVMSAAYRQSAGLPSRDPKPGLKNPQLVDPENRLLWRFPPRRLDAEQARDAVLAASGELDLTMYGEGVEAGKPRRSVYTRKIRNTQDEFLQSLDAPPGFSSMPTRDATTTATQSLLMINGDWPLERARAMGARLARESSATDAQLVEEAYALAFARKPKEQEKAQALAFLDAQRSLLKKQLPPPPVEVPVLAAASKWFGSEPLSKTTKAMWLQPGTRNEKLRAATVANGRVEGNEFAIEAVVYLDSLYPDGTVRTIVSRWNNNKADRGWAFGVTSAKSAYQPNNLILQFSGEDFQGSLMYEVVASNLRVTLQKPFYVAAVISDEPASPEQTFGGSVTFYARDLSDPSAPMQTAKVPHQVCGGFVNPERALYVGGRDQDKRSLWHGAIARVALRDGAMDPGKLMTWAAASDATCLADISADFVSDMTGKSPSPWRWESSAPPATSQGTIDPHREALADLCHILLNSNEFFYLH